MAERTRRPTRCGHASSAGSPTTPTPRRGRSCARCSSVTPPDELAERFAHGLSFGTAGLRGRLGAGPSRMNVATVRRASAGLARYLLDAVEGAREAGVVVGHDARHGSARFAAEAAAVFSGAGLRTYTLPPLAPTPLLAFAVRRAGLRGGRDGHRQPQPAAGQRLQGLPRRRRPDLAAGRRAHRGRDRRGRRRRPAAARRRRRAPATRSPRPTWPRSSPRCPTPTRATVRIAYTPLHGVGAKLCLEAFERAGFPAPHVVAEQLEPDPDFPTVPAPTRRSRARSTSRWPTAAAHGADVLLANDPDADRLAVAIPGGGRLAAPARRRDRRAARRLPARAREDPRRALLVTTIASSTLLGRMAEAAGARYAETLTGFKWIMRAVAEAPEHRLRSPTRRRSATPSPTACATRTASPRRSCMAQLAANEKRAGRTLADRLEAIAARYGRHATAQLTLELDGAGGQERMRGDHGGAARARRRPRCSGGRWTCVDDWTRRAPPPTARGAARAAALRRARPARATARASSSGRAAPSRSSRPTSRSSPATAARRPQRSPGCAPS